MDATDTKKCTGPCGRELPIDSFHRRAAGPLGLQSACKECRKARSQARKQFYTLLEQTHG